MEIKVINKPQLDAEILEINKTKQKTITHSVIWLHGLGADGHDFVSLIPELQLPKSLAIRFIFPHAPVRPITINNGLVMRAWYDITSTSFENSETEVDILASVAQIQTFIEAEIESGIKSEHILLAGFSQGGVIALHTALRFPARLAGIMALSTYLPFADKLLRNRAIAQQGLTIFAAHGREDAIIPFEKSQHYSDQLKQQGFAVQFVAYTMGHSLCAEEIVDIRNWLLAKGFRARP